MDRQKTGALIAQMRKERGLTQRELAEQLHVSDRAVSKWERGAGFPDVSMLVPLAEALGLSVLELLQGEQSAPCDSEGAARLALDSVQQVQGWKRQERWRQYICAVLGVGALVLWLAVCGLISLPANRTCLAWVYQDGQQQELTLVHWSGTLQFRLPLRWEFRGQIQTPLAQTTLDPDRELHLALPLTWDKTTSLSHQSWYGNIREQEGPFLSAPFYLDWWGGEFAFSLSDGTIISGSVIYTAKTGGAALIYEDEELANIRQLEDITLTDLDALSLTATSGNRSYDIAEDVQVLLRDTNGSRGYYLTTLSEIDSSSYTLKGWYDDFGCSAGGRIRIIVATPEE